MQRRANYVLRRLQDIAAVACLAFCVPAHAQGVTSWTSYSRASSFEYYQVSDGAKNGMLKREKIEPDTPESCVQTTHNWDAWGNKTSVVTSNCSGATGDALFTSRTTTQTWSRDTQPTFAMSDGRVLEIQPGQFPLDTKNALLQAATQLFDPRFGTPIQQVDANGLVTEATYDALGRKTRDDKPDGTGVIYRYCVISGLGIDVSSNSSGCFVPEGVPADAVAFVQSYPVNTNNSKMGPWSMVITDKLGRTLRVATEAFDGTSQPAAVLGGTIVQDNVYDNNGNKYLATQPYFLETGSSTTSGANNAGVTKTVFDALGRVQKVYVVDSQGTSLGVGFGASPFAGYGAYGYRAARLTEIAYIGQKTVTTDYFKQTAGGATASRIRTEERNPIGEVARVTDDYGAQLVIQRDAFGDVRYTKDPLGNINTVYMDVRGRKVQMLDKDAGKWEYGYNALGELLWQRNPKQRNASPVTRTEMSYDVLGRMTQRVDDEYVSNWFFDKNEADESCSTTSSAGRLCESKTSHGVRRRYWYDAVGRPTSDRLDVTGGISAAQSLQWNSTTSRLSKRTWPTGLATWYDYTGLGFVSQIKLAQSATIKPLPSTPGGSVAADTSWDANRILWRAEIQNAWGSSERFTSGDAADTTTVTTRSQYDGNNGRLLNRYAGLSAGSSTMNQGFTYDTLGRLNTRVDRNGTGDGNDVSEQFTYDDLDRLINYTTSHPQITNLQRSVAITYNALGQILKRSDVGAYSYTAIAGQSAPHTIKKFTDLSGTVTNYQYDANGNQRTADNGKYRYADYNSFNRLNSDLGIRGPVVPGYSASPRYTWQYDSEHARIKETKEIFGTTANAGVRTTWRIHPDDAGGMGFEYEVDAPTTPSAAYPATQQSRHYITAAGQVVAVLVSEGALPTLSAPATSPPTKSIIILRKVENWQVDHLGSIVVTTNHLGAITARYSYDPFGQRRYTTGADDPTQAISVDWDPALNRYTGNGFTSHEHMDDLGIIHMNGRVFNPRLGLFLQPDPMIQDPLGLQNYNRYGYCYNSPMGCTDMSGLCFMGCFWQPKNWGAFRYVAAIAIAVYAPEYLSTYVGAFNAAAISGFMSGAISSGNMKGALQGAFSAGMFSGAGNLISGGTFFTPGTADAVRMSAEAGVMIHGVVGCVTTAAAGGKCGAGALSAAFSQGVGQYKQNLSFGGGLIVSAVVGGTASVLGGGKFSNGATTATYGYLFNYCGLGHGNDCFKSFREGLNESSIGRMWESVFGPPREAKVLVTFAGVSGSVAGAGGTAGGSVSVDGAIYGGGGKASPLDYGGPQLAFNFGLGNWTKDEVHGFYEGASWSTSVVSPFGVGMGVTTSPGSWLTSIDFVIGTPGTKSSTGGSATASKCLANCPN